MLNRTRQVKINSALSNILENGVPQGSVISPTLFSIMINNILLSAGSSSCLFANDVALLVARTATKRVLKCMQNILDGITQWAHDWGLSLSPIKSESVTFIHSQKDKNPQFKLNNRVIPNSNQITVLGMIFDSKLTWPPHIDCICTKANKTINLMQYITGTNWGQTKLPSIFFIKVISTNLSPIELLPNKYI